MWVLSLKLTLCLLSASHLRFTFLHFFAVSPFCISSLLLLSAFPSCFSFLLLLPAVEQHAS